jgi:N-acetylneuraminate synthase
MKNLPQIEISGRFISRNHSPYIIAEMSANHNGSIKNAKGIIEAAKSSGADAVKIQTYKPDTITLDHNSNDFKINGGLWDGRTLFDLYEEAHMPWDWHKPLFDYAREIGITIFSSPFDSTAVDLLESLNAPAYKIASFEIVDTPLIKYVASTGKPLIISTGMANKEEIHEAIQAARDGGCSKLAILHCVSGYPAPAADYNLKTLADMANEFGLVTGLSDHTLKNITAISSISMGASIIEKHFTLDRCNGGPDDSFSLEPSDLKELCESAKIAWESIGCIDYSRKSSEEGNVKFRRSLYFVQDMKQGQIITKDCVRSVRPGFGISPNKFDYILGKRIKNNVNFGTPVKISDIDI